MTCYDIVFNTQISWGLHTLNCYAKEYDKVMRTLKNLLQSTLLFSALMTPVLSAQAFIVQGIRIIGLHRIQEGTVLNYLPVNVGQDVSANDTSKILQALYKTGFFDNISLYRQGNELVVKVVERPTIGDISFSGNKAIDNKKINEILKQVGLEAGQVYNQSLISRVQHALIDEYDSLGRYNAKIEVKETKESRNRMAVRLAIYEGSIAKIREIKILGNHAFSTDTLLDQFKLSTPGILSWFTHDDQYTKAKLDASLEALRSYYMDRGYINFKVDSAQVALTPDRDSVFIVVKITEGEQYHVNGFKFSGDLIVPEEQLQKLVTFEKGDIFSRKEITATSLAVATALGNKGYAFANVNAEPTLDHQTREVFLNFVVEPGQRIYVRHIEFSGNTKTSDSVLRQAVRQPEASLVSVQNIKESVRQLNLLGFLKNVSVKTKPVPNHNNEVDLDFNVQEAAAAQAVFGVGYGTDGFLFNASLNQPNFLGTGKTVNIGFQTTSYSRSYNFTYFNPYYTPSGIGRGFSVYAQHVNSGRINIASYSTNSIGGNVSYTIPVSENNNVNLGYGYSRTQMVLGSSTSTQLRDFVRRNGKDFNQVNLSAGWQYIGQNRAIFPTRGLNQSITGNIYLPGGGNSLRYFKLGYDARWYHPIAYGFLAHLGAQIGYGNGFFGDQLPIFANYYAGGISFGGQVRGYQSNTLGPRDSNDDPLGGNLMTTATVGLVVPNPVSDNLRTMAFVDAGNVYDDGGVNNFTHGAGPLRLSSGVAIEWRTPIAPLEFSLAKPLNLQPGDHEQFFQFTIATGLGGGSGY